MRNKRRTKHNQKELKRSIALKNTAYGRPHPNKKCSNQRPIIFITFPQGFRISKNIGHPTSGSGGKKTLKRYLKSEQTDGHTDGQIDL